MAQSSQARTKLIVVVAPVGPPDDPGPRTPAEVADEVVAARAAGASLVHLHVRDAAGRQVTELRYFRETVACIRERCDILIEGSTGGPASLSREERSVALQAEGLELATLNAGSVNFWDDVYINTVPDILEWAEQMRQKEIKPDCAVFDLSMLHTVSRLAREGLLGAAPPMVSLSLGFEGALPATPSSLVTLLQALPEGAIWAYLEHGHSDLTMHAAAIGLGGHVRVGFEDSREMGLGRRAMTNAELVEAVVRLATAAGREIASPEEARQILGVKPRNV